MHKIINFINQLNNFCNKVGVSVKHASLLLIAVISFLLIVLGFNGLDFGIIALVCWIFAFLDLARIKFKDYEVDFMSKKQALTADERRLFLDNYNLVNAFIFEHLKCGYVNKEALDNIQKAYIDANLLLPKEIVEYTKTWAEKAKDAFILHCRWERLPVGKERSELISEEHEITKEIIAIKPAEVYRKYIKVGGSCTE